MTLPRTLTLVRHGESESNLAKRSAEKGQSHPNAKVLAETHTSRRRLTERGVRQAKKAEEWLKKYFEEEKMWPFLHQNGVRGFFSPYIRAMETAGHLGLPIVWKPDYRLSERNWGKLDQLTYEERIEKYGTLDERERHGIYWPAGNGESLQAVATRVWQHFDMLAREHSDHHVIEVSHGETILTQRFMLERWLPEDLVEMMLRTDSRLSKEVLGQETDWRNKIINCRIIQYTRLDDTGCFADHYTKVRLVAPSSPDDPNKNTGWIPIKPKQFTSEELLKYAEQFPHIL